MAFYDGIDIRWSWTGDFLPGADGDFADSEPDQIQYLVDMIRTIVQSDVDDWEEHPSIGANLSDYIGEPNSRENGDKISRRVKAAIVTARVANAVDTSVRVIPITSSTIMVLVKINALSTPNNSLGPESGVVVSSVFDYSERGVVPLGDTTSNSFFTQGAT